MKYLFSKKVFLGLVVFGLVVGGSTVLQGQAEIQEPQDQIPLISTPIYKKITEQCIWQTMYNTPSLGDNGLVYAVAGSDCAETGYDATGFGVAAFNPLDGSDLWGPVIPSACRGIKWGTSVGKNGLVYSTGEWNECGSGQIIALDSDNGNLAWHESDGTHVRQVPALNESVGQLYYGTDSIVSRNMLTGEFGWSVGGGLIASNGGTVIDELGNIIDKTTNQSITRVRSVSSAGELLWIKEWASAPYGTVNPDSFTIDNLLLLYNGVANRMEAYNTFGDMQWFVDDIRYAVTDKTGNIFVARVNSPEVISFTKDGVLRWSTILGGYTKTGVDFVTDSGEVYVRADNTIFSIDTETGNPTKIFEADAEIKTRTILVPGGDIFFSDIIGVIYRLETDLEYANSVWAVAEYGNRRHTQRMGDPLFLSGINGIKPQCSDGVDNDGDDKIDYPNDLGCESNEDNSEECDIDISLSNNTIDENSPIGTTIGSFLTTGGEPPYSYQLIHGSGSEDNMKFWITDSDLKLNFVPDYENPEDWGDTVGDNTYSIRVKSEDSSVGEVDGVDYSSARNNFGGFNNAPSCPNIYAFTALKSDGSIASWGGSDYGGSGAPSDSGYTKIYSTGYAFAALKSDGSITAWGYPSHGGSGAPDDSGYTKIYSTDYAFAALKSDGSITAWGYPDNGGSGAPGDSGYIKIYSTRNAFAALKSDGSITAWGRSDYGGSGAPDDSGYTKIYSTDYAFAALKSDGSITAWGYPDNGGSGAPGDSGYIKIYSTGRAFAALKPDGSITAWGSSDYGGSGAPGDSGYTKIYSAGYAFVALKLDGSITAWGRSDYGGSGAPGDSGYTKIYSTNYAFATLKSDGSITAWGRSDYGGSGAPGDSGYTKIYSTALAFATLKSDGSITVWGNSNYGGSGAPGDSGYTKIYSTALAFATLKSDGSITVWGNSNYGGSGAPNDSGYTIPYGGEGGANGNVKEKEFIITVNDVEAEENVPPILSYSTEDGYDDDLNDSLNTNPGVHPDKVAAKKDMLTFKAVYTDNMAPDDVRVIFKHDKNFTTNDHLHEMVHDLDLREKLAWKDISEIYSDRTGRVFGMDNGWFDKGGFDGDDSLLMDILGEDKTKVSVGVTVTDFGYMPALPRATITLEAFDKEGRSIKTEETTVELLSDENPVDHVISIESKEGLIGKVKFSVSNTTESETWIQSFTTFEELEMTPDSLATTIDPLLKDNDFSNGEQYVATSTFSRGNYSFSITASSTDGQIVRLPGTGDLTFLVKELFVYVALGDSYQSGEGVGNSELDTDKYKTLMYEDGTNAASTTVGLQENTYTSNLVGLVGNACHRSLFNYAKINRDKLKPGVDDDAIVLVDRTCSGATIRPGDIDQKTIVGVPEFDFVDSKSQINNAIERLKIINLTADDVNLVTVGMGGNDVGFANVVGSCVMNSLIQSVLDQYPNAPPEIKEFVQNGITILGYHIDGVTCERIAEYVADEEFDTIFDNVRIAELWAQEKLLESFAKARILQLNYPNILPLKKNADEYCGGILKDDLDFANNITRRLNNAVNDSVDTSSLISLRYELVDIESSLGKTSLCLGTYANGISNSNLNVEVGRLLNLDSNGDAEARKLLDELVNNYEEFMDCVERKVNLFQSCSILTLRNKGRNVVESKDNLIEYLTTASTMTTIFANLASSGNEEENLRFDRARGLFHPNRLGFKTIACYVRAVFTNSNINECKVPVVVRPKNTVNSELIQNIPISSTPSADIHLHMEGFAVTSDISLFFFSKQIDLGTLMSDENGVVDTIVTLPEAGPGVHTLELRGDTPFGIGVHKQIRFSYNGRPVGDGSYAEYLCGFTPNFDGTGDVEQIDIHYYSDELGGPLYTLVPDEYGCVFVEVPLFDISNQSTPVDIIAKSQYSNTEVSVTINPIPSVVSLWSLKSEFNSLSITGSKNSVIGKIHSEANIIVKGSQNLFDESPEYVTDIIIKGNKHVIPEGRKVEPGGLPKTWAIDDYRPGGFLTLEAGDSYHIIPEDSCIDGLWSVDAKDIPDGIVYAPCSVEIYGSDEIVNTIIVAEGWILISGSKIILGQNKPSVPAVLTPYNGKEAFRISGASNQINGTVQVLNGGVRIVGSKGVYRCGIIAQTIKVEGSNNEFIVDEECRKR